MLSIFISQMTLLTLLLNTINCLECQTCGYLLCELFQRRRLIFSMFLTVSCSVMPNSLQPTRLLCPWDFPGKDTGVSRHFLLWGIFPGIKLGSTAQQADSLPTELPGKPRKSCSPQDLKMIQTLSFSLVNLGKLRSHSLCLFQCPC